MTETIEDKRPFWRKRRFWGGVVSGAAAVIATIPGAPVIATIGAVQITTVTVAALLGFIGTNVFSYGKGRAVERTAKK